MDAHNNKQLNILTVDMVDNNIHTTYNGHEDDTMEAHNNKQSAILTVFS